MPNIIQRQQRLQGATPVAQRSPYQELYGLRENPFPVMALFSSSSDDPRQNGDIYDRDFRLPEEKLFFERFVQPTTGDAPARLGFVCLDPQAGGRGNGKSVFLHHLMRRVNEQEWNDWPIDRDSPDLFALAIHVLPEPRRQRRFWQLIRLVFETLADQMLGDHTMLADIDVNFRAAVLLELLNPSQQEQLSNRDNDSTMTALKSKEAFTVLLGEFGLTLAAFVDQGMRQLRETNGGALDATFSQAFRDSGLDLAAMWSQWEENGIAMSDYQWRRNGTAWFINGLVPVMMAAGYRRFIVLLDEFEKIYLYQASREREEFLDEVRQHFFERPSAAVRRGFLSMVLTIHPSIQRYLREVWTRVGLESLAPLDPSRMTQQAVTLGTSTVEKLTHLLIVYIDAFRASDQNRGTVYPFAEGALDAAFEAAKFYPRDTLWFACNIIKEAADKGVHAPITVEFVKAFVASGMRPSAESDDVMFQLPATEGKLTE